MLPDDATSPARDARDVRSSAFPRLVLFLSAVPFAGIGLAFLFAPTKMAALVGLSLADATATADTRAVYGGLQIGCAAFLVRAAREEDWLRPGLALQIATFGGLFLARVYSYVASGLLSPLGYFLHAGEALALLLGVIAWRQLDRRAKSGGR